MGKRRHHQRQASEQTEVAADPPPWASSSSSRRQQPVLKKAEPQKPGPQQATKEERHQKKSRPTLAVDWDPAYDQEVVKMTGSLRSLTATLQSTSGQKLVADLQKTAEHMKAIRPSQMFSATMRKLLQAMEDQSKALCEVELESAISFHQAEMGSLLAAVKQEVQYRFLNRE